MHETQLRNIGESALKGLMDRDGMSDILKYIKHHDTELWQEIILEVGEYAYYAVKARQSAH